MFVEVVFPLPVRQGFTYSVPRHLESEVKPGVQVLAPLGKKVTAGIATRLLAKTEIKTKPIVQVNPLGPLLSSQLLELTRWTANYYFCSWGEAIKAALPGMKTKPQVWVEFLPKENLDDIDLTVDQEKLLAHLESKPKARLSSAALSRKFRNFPVGEILRELENKGTIELSYSSPTISQKIKSEQMVQRVDFPPPVELNHKEREVWEFLRPESPVLVKEIKRNFPQCGKILKRMQNEGLIKIEEKEVWQDFWQTYVVPEKKEIELNAEQKGVLEKIEAGLKKKTFSPYLLQGVTGSGKTEIYVRACQTVLEQGRTALVLVPEISLAAQTILSFRAVFQDKAIKLHSGLTEKERSEAWRRIKAGKYPVVIGVRSAIFAPLEKVGLIIVDEEHDNSYKQSDPAPRYNARDLALVRGKLEKAAVILGSATPSLESYYNALNGKYTLLTLPERVQRKPLPKVEIIDLKAERKNGNYGFFSERLKQEIKQELQEKQQIILFLNRRGFSTLIKCQECGFVPICRNCNITLTYHREGLWLKCHLCGYQKKAPSACPACNSLKFLYRGAGTQRIEAEIKELAGEESVRRLDSDVSAKRNYARNLLLDFQAGKFSILLGTQMVTKGYDFPEVTLVGVISADISLELPDFRAPERTFQLLTQVAGRCGRGEKPGKVLVQTFHPLEYSIQLASQQDYAGFYQHEISTRRELGYPPFCHLIMLLVSGVDLAKVQKGAEKLAELLSNSKPNGLFKLLGPAPAPLEKVRRKYRYRVMLKTKQVFETLRILQEILQPGKLESKKEVRITVDVDPVDLL